MDREEIKNQLKGIKIKKVRSLLVNLILKHQKTPHKQNKTNTNKQILNRDNQECVLCGDKNDLQIHHLKPKNLRKDKTDGIKITLCKYCHWYLHHNPKSDLNHSVLIKNSIVNINGETFSNNGNRWGRRRLDFDKKILILYSKGKKMREICDEVYYWDGNNHKKFVSLGYVHKVLNKKT